MLKLITTRCLICLIPLSADAAEHYLDRYRPVAIYTLDQDPAVSDLSDTTSRYQATVHKADAGLPRLENGARGFSGQAWNFKGVDSSFSSEATGKIQTLGDIENTKGISVSFWMKIPLKDQKNHFRVLGHPAFEATMATAGYGGLGIAFGPGYHVMLSRSAGYTAFDNLWHHIVATADFSTRRDNVVIYLDGEEVARADGAANECFNNRDPRTRVYIGARRNGGHAFTGALDDVSVYDYPLSPEQVLGIYTGPVFAGAPQEVYLPDAAKLKGIAPKGSSLTWSKKSGPGEVTFADASQADTVVRFSVPGEYELRLAVKGMASQLLKVRVHPPTPPIVVAGDPRQVAQGKTTTLTARVTVPGRVAADLAGVELAWSKLDGPGEVAFASPDASATEASFSKPGLYHLQLRAERAGLTGADIVSVIVGDTPRDHYALLLNPLYLFGLDEPANRDSAGIYDLAQGTCAEMSGPAVSRLPQSAPGARPYTGYAWDFARTPTKLKVHNRFNIARLGNTELTRGLSFSVWIKAEQYTDDLGRIGGWAGVSVSPHKYTGGAEIDNGTLQVNGSLASSDITVQGGTFEGSGTITDNLGTSPDLITLTTGVYGWRFF